MVARLFSVPTEGNMVRVAAELFPTHAHASAEPQWRFYELDPHQAARLVEETLDAFQYLGCAVIDIEPIAGEGLAPAAAA